jgi:hypothetical protein
MLGILAVGVAQTPHALRKQFQEVMIVEAGMILG